jgi:hypothetical protein
MPSLQLPCRHARLFVRVSQSQFLTGLSTSGNSFPQNGSKTVPKSQNRPLGYPHIGPFVGWPVPCHVKPISIGNHPQRAIRSEAYLGGAHLGAERCPLIIPSSVFLCLILFGFTNFVGPGFSPLQADGFVPHTQPVDLRRVGSSE